MPLPEKFYDQDGNQTSLSMLCKKEPEWAANQIRYLHQQIDKLALQPVNTADHKESGRFYCKDCEKFHYFDDRSAPCDR